MAFARPLAQLDENVANDRQKPANKAQAAQGQGKSRRALGDIGNLVGPFNSRCNVGKENAGAKKADNGATADGGVQPLKPTGVVTRRAAAAAGVVIDQKILGQLSHKPRHSLSRAKDGEVATTSEPQLDVKEAAVSNGNSMTGLLVSRSEDAVALPKAVLPPSPAPDIDSRDKEDPLAATEYVGDIFSYYRRVEPMYRVPPDYMSKQTDINDKMRAILIDWLVEVHLKFKLMPETLFLTTNLIDRFLELKPVTRKNLQLVGVTAMLIASKYEEIWAPEVRDFVYISDRAYTKEQILNMEKIILNTLGFNLTVPTPNSFLCRFLKAANFTSNKEVATYAAYLVELSLPDYSMLKYSYSMVAAASVYLAGKALKAKDPFPYDVQKHSGFGEQTLRPCIQALSALQRKAANASLVAVFKKYSSTKYLQVAIMPGPGNLAPEPPTSI